jgi:hypothetical protein
MQLKKLLGLDRLVGHLYTIGRGRESATEGIQSEPGFLRQSQANIREVFS